MSQQPSLFAPALPDPVLVSQVRDVAIRRVAARAEQTRPEFGAQAQAFVLAFLQQHGPTPGEVLTLACKAAGIAPHDDRAFGHVYLSLSKRKQIVPVGSVPRLRGNGTSGGRVWALVAREER